LLDGCGGNQRTDVTIRATLYNYEGGIPINASETITVNFDTTYSDCLGSGANSLTLQILPNNSYGERVYSELTYEPCPYDQQCNPVSITVNGVQSITPSGYVQCSTEATPTITPTTTSSIEPFDWKCDNGSCIFVGDGSGDYVTQQDCLNNCQQTIYSCKEGEFGFCMDQVGPCTGNQIECGPSGN
jgi:hypothetical protein